MWDGVFGTENSKGGIPGLPPLRLAQIVDGTSHTAAFAEVANGLAPEVALRRGTGNPLADCFEYGGPPSGSLETIRNDFLSRSWTRASIPWSGEWRYRGYPWSEGTLWRTWYNHILPPNSVCWRPGSWWKLVSPATSYHNGTVNVVLCDGSVQSISQDVDPDIWCGMGTRDGKPVGQ